MHERRVFLHETPFFLHGFFSREHEVCGKKWQNLPCVHVEGGKLRLEAECGGVKTGGCETVRNGAMEKERRDTVSRFFLVWRKGEERT